jgi:hypothetical protein
MSWFVRKKNPIVEKIFNVLLEKKFEGTWINGVYQDADLLTVKLHLPEHKEVKDLKKILTNMKEELTATDVKLGKMSGKHIDVLFGTRKLGSEDKPFPYDRSLALPGQLSLRFPSAFGWKNVNFWSESFWHCLLGGATGMGKSNLLYYLITQLFLNMDGNITFYISSAKVRTDFYMFENIPQIPLAETVEETREMLAIILDEAEDRKNLLKKHRVRDVKMLREKGINLSPIFIVIDEYTEIAEEDDIQDAISHIARVLRYLDFHLIICTQRPDATSTIPTNVRSNLLGNIALACRDAVNSRMIIGTDEAAQDKLGKIKGRAVILDGFTEIIQVPYLKETTIQKLLNPYRSVTDEQERPEDPEIPGPIPSIEQTPTGEIVFSGEQKSSSSGKSSYEKTKATRKHHYHSKAKRQVLPVYAEPNYDSSELNQD